VKININKKISLMRNVRNELFRDELALWTSGFTGMIIVVISTNVYDVLCPAALAACIKSVRRLLLLLLLHFSLQHVAELLLAKTLHVRFLSVCTPRWRACGPPGCVAVQPPQPPPLSPFDRNASERHHTHLARLSHFSRTQHPSVQYF